MASAECEQRAGPHPAPPPTLRVRHRPPTAPSGPQARPRGCRTQQQHWDTVTLAPLAGWNTTGLRGPLKPSSASRKPPWPAPPGGVSASLGTGECRPAACSQTPLRLSLPSSDRSGVAGGQCVCPALLRLPPLDSGGALPPPHRLADCLAFFTCWRGAGSPQGDSGDSAGFSAPGMLTEQSGTGLGAEG